MHLDQIRLKLSAPALHLQDRANRKPFRKSKSRTVRLLCGALLMAMPFSASNASTSEPRTSQLTQPALDRQIERVLQNDEYSWRPRPGPDETTPSQKQNSMLERWMASIRSMLISLGDWMSRLLKSLLKPFNFKTAPAQPTTSGDSLSSGLFSVLGYLLWAAFAGTLILFVIRILKLKAIKFSPALLPSQKPDLTDEEVEADQLPDNEWYALAREKMAAGEFRQAQRALFLAILSNLAAHRLITVERWKSNTDYEKELTRKAKHPSELPALFAQSRLGFERCWYGADTVTPADLEKYNRAYERIKHAAD